MPMCEKCVDINRLFAYNFTCQSDHSILQNGHGDSNLYYKRVDPYFWTELAPVLEGAVSRRRHPRKGTRVDRVCVGFVARVDRRIFTIRQKRIRGGGAFAEGSLNQSRLLL